MASAISAACVSSAKWPVSKKRTVGVRDVAPEGFGAGRQEERIVLAPHRQERRLVGAEIVLEGRIERDVALVVAEQIELHLVGAGPRQIEIVERIAVRRDRRHIRYAVGVLPDRRLGLEEGAQRVAVFLPTGLPNTPGSGFQPSLRPSS